MAKLLIVEDERDLAQQLQDWFVREKYLVDTVFDGQEALNHLNVYKYDLVILDWMLPLVDGVEVMRRMKAKDIGTPVIMLTARGNVADKELGLDTGADDYITKPFSLRELSARVRAAIRRSGHSHQGKLRFGALELDPQSRRLAREGHEIHLEPKEFNLLEFFMRHPNQVFSADALIDRVWPSDTAVSSDAIRTYIKVLRKKIDAEGAESMIRNVRGVGYKFEPGATIPQ